MTLSTYAGLQSTIITYAFRSGDADFTAMVPTFIALCETRVGRDLRVRDMEKTATITLADNIGDLPADYLQIKSLIDTNHPHWTLTSGSVDQGRGYAIEGSTVKIFGCAQTGDLSLSYYAAIPALSDSNTTNWLLTKAPDIYLYGSLIEAMPFMMDDQRTETWATLYQKAVDELQSADTMSRFANAGVKIHGPTP